MISMAKDSNSFTLPASILNVGMVFTIVCSTTSSCLGNSIFPYRQEGTELAFRIVTMSDDGLVALVTENRKPHTGGQFQLCSPPHIGFSPQCPLCLRGFRFFVLALLLRHFSGRKPSARLIRFRYIPVRHQEYAPFRLHRK